MNKNTGPLASWAIHKIEENFPDDVCLLLEHRTLKLEKDADAIAFSYYIPATNRANGLARTFIVDGIGYDLFPISWERVERMADVKEYNTTLLADAEILWVRSDADRQRFASLQARLRANLQNPQYMLERAQKWLETAKEVYGDMLFEERLYKVRTGAGYICDLLSIAVAFANGRYFPHGQTGQIAGLSGVERLPAEFISLYNAIVREASPDAQKQLCQRMIVNTEAFLTPPPQGGAMPEPDFSELASWYQELIYTWRRVYHWCDAGDPVTAYLWCCMLQSECDEWGKRFGIEDTDILGAYNADDLSALRSRAGEVEAAFRQAIAAGGAALEEYDTVEDFLKSN